ncbi:hypothetical protein BGW36DRAFT_117355 [Talaromyces proteolyticus]|uniref:Uncharacterized protein n=1 Tax=Talaromyces proteolyticus TaxID=1131652 RepID=A0AAD4L3C8_9EURO|nr:uncharacterized protein BGW36DRAFT_117355 [Talaromyces proteolyticus]KAH8702464.1 hypothetical protein BGW36DRAFT_117355 [Talaromyces proteolyticus]
METVPLTLAHTHARNALLETRKSNPVAASEEHDLAAGEFATASQNCVDAYALRTLKLLEEEHKRLAVLLRSQHEHPQRTASPELSTSSPPQKNAQTELPPLSKPAPTTSQHTGAGESPQQPPRLPGHNRKLQRESSSIASNLASARGIPANPRRGSPVSPTLSAQHAGGQLSDSPSRTKPTEGRLRERGGRVVPAPKQPWSPPSISPTEITSRQVIPADAYDAQSSKGRFAAVDEPFQRFYSTFEGLISKISAPLAFAGLPLGADNSETTRQKSSAETKLDRNNAISDRPSASVEGDINHLFSRAALRAVRDANGGMPSNAAESFYVVPTTGGTVSYAGILSRAEKEARRNSMDDGGDEDFVDARETPSSPELLQNLASSKTAKGSRGYEKSTKTNEELCLENEALKQLTDQLSKRLHMWEVNAQSSSLALQQSLKAIHHQQHVNTSSPTASSAIPAPIAIPATNDHEKRIKELEELVRSSKKEAEKITRENEKLKVVLGRYRERWEKLKEGAKTRRNADVAAGPGGTPSMNQGEDDLSVTPVQTPKIPNDSGNAEDS